MNNHPQADQSKSGKKLTILLSVILAVTSSIAGYLWYTQGRVSLAMQ